MDKANEAIYAIRRVNSPYNKKYDATQTLAFSLIAEHVAEVYPDPVGRNPEGQRYDQINAMLLNEFLKAHRKMAGLHRFFRALLCRGWLSNPLTSSVLRFLSCLLSVLEDI